MRGQGRDEDRDWLVEISCYRLQRLVGQRLERGQVHDRRRISALQPVRERVLDAEGERLGAGVDGHIAQTVLICGY